MKLSFHSRLQWPPLDHPELKRENSGTRRREVKVEEGGK